MWHYLMFSSTNDSAIQLGSVARISGAVAAAISPNLRMSEHGGLSSQVKCHMLSVPTHGAGAAIGGLGGPCFVAGDGKTPSPSALCFRRVTVDAIAA